MEKEYIKLKRELKGIIFSEISDYYNKKTRKETLKTKIIMLEDLIQFLRSTTDEFFENKAHISILITSIFDSFSLYEDFYSDMTYIKRVSDNGYTEIDDYLKTKQSYEDKIQKLEQTLVEFVDEFMYLKHYEENCYKYIHDLKQALYRLKHGQTLNEASLNAIGYCLNRNEVLEQIKLKLIEVAVIHNKTVLERFKNLPATYKFSVLEMLNFGFEIIEDESLDYNPKTEKIADIQMENLKYIEDDSIIFDEIDGITKDENLKKSVYIEIIRRIQEKILLEIQMVREEDFFVDEEIKEELIKEYNINLKHYINFRNKYLSLCVEEEQIVEENCKTFIFSKTKYGTPHILEDIADVPQEYLEHVEKLLEDFKKGKIRKKQIEGFVDMYKKFRKLKQDQIRITVTQVKDDIYCVTGVATKKSQEGDRVYKKLCTRTIPDISKEELLKQELESSLKTEQEIHEYVKTHARKGNR